MCSLNSRWGGIQCVLQRRRLIPQAKNLMSVAISTKVNYECSLFLVVASHLPISLSSVQFYTYLSLSWTVNTIFYTGQWVIVWYDGGIKAREIHTNPNSAVGFWHQYSGNGPQWLSWFNYTGLQLLVQVLMKHLSRSLPGAIGLLVFRARFFFQIESAMCSLITFLTFTSYIAMIKQNFHNLSF